MQALAKRHGLLGILVDGVEKLPSYLRPPLTTWLQWIGEVMQGYEQRYEKYREAVSGLVSFYNGHGYQTMILKGLSCGINWPKPEHRPYGDIDIYQFGRYKDSDATLARELGIKIDNSHHHHTVFEWEGFTVENHYDFINVHHHKSHVELENVFKVFGLDCNYCIEVCDNKVIIPSPNLHALFLVRHAMNHFVSIGISLRQILDYAFFVEKNNKKIDWVLLEELLDRFGMTSFFNIINSICVDNLGFDVKIFPRIQPDLNLKEMFLTDIISLELPNSQPRHIWNIYRRWKSNEWKRKLCYNESNSLAFWWGIKKHLLKPKV